MRFCAMLADVTAAVASRLTREHTLEDVRELKRVAASGGDVALPRTPGAPLRVVRHDELGREHRLMPTRTIGVRTGSAVCTVERLACSNDGDANDLKSDHACR